jgi:predicted ATP-dependent endonuclease of OLD family
MFLSEIYASGFRCFGPEQPLILSLRKGLNVIVGPNDAGKTAVVDAPRYVLWTRGDDFQRLDPSDFHVRPCGERVTDLLIRCKFDGLSAEEQSRFLEWCTNDGGTINLYICLRGALRMQQGGGYSVMTQYRSCKDADGPAVEGDLREYLRTTYLRPLRDAERELRSGRRSRLSRILGALPTMAEQSVPAAAGAPATLLDTEEPEAHLHAQHQTLFMQVLEDKAAEPRAGEGRQQVQVLLSTHSPTLAAGVNLEAMIMMVGHKVFPLAKGKTKLEPDDYGFLRRFLDATKANVFFARGLIVVEGDAENLLLPAIARKIGRPLGKHGVSIVKVGHRGLFRYSRILQRSDDSAMPVRVALIPDRDIPPDAAKQLVGERLTEGEWKLDRKQAHITNLSRDAGGAVRAFPSPQWTLEYDLARAPGLAALVHQAIRVARGQRGRTRDQIIADASAEVVAWQANAALNDDAIAATIYEPLYKDNVSKAEVAEQLARLIDELQDDAATFRPKLPAYLVEAIDYATGTGGEQVA